MPDGFPRSLTVRSAAAQWEVSKSTAARWLATGRVPVGQTPQQAVSEIGLKSCRIRMERRTGTFG